MGYKKSFNLVTIQLIIPLSTMTKAEYKNAYGIDLDDIDIERVTLVQEEGSKNKYFVDEIKETESGVDIYAGGNILSIGSSVSVTKNAYSVANSKPLYVHPIILSSSGSTKISFIIINNSPTPYTIDTLFAELRTWSDGKQLLCVGGDIYALNNNVSFSPAYILTYANSFYFIGVDSAGVLHTETGYEIEFKASDYNGIFDYVNKLN